MLKYFVTRAYYADCPTCGHIGDPQIRGYATFEEFLKDYTTEYDYGYYELYLVSENTLISVADLWPSFGFHHIKSRHIKFSNNKEFELVTHGISTEFFKEVLEYGEIQLGERNVNL